MHQRFMERAKRMAATRMPDTSACRITLMGQPCICFEVFQFIVFNNIFRISHDFQDHHVPAVRHDKSLFFTKRRIIVRINLKAVLIDKLILGVTSFH